MLPDEGFEGFEVYIERVYDEEGKANERLNEHSHPEPSSIDGTTKIKTCYLECPDEDDVPFRIVVLKLTGRLMSDVVAWPSVDGRSLPGLIFRTTFIGSNSIAVLTERRGAELVQGSLTFGKLTTTDDDQTTLNNPALLDQLGTIEVMFEKVKLGKQCVGQRFVTDGSLVVHEKQKKAAIDRAVKIGKDVKPVAPTALNVSITHLDFTKQKLVFKYCTRQMLMARRVIEAPSPTLSANGSNEGSEDVEDIEDIEGIEKGSIRTDKHTTREEIRRLEARLRRLRRRESTTDAVKEESSDERPRKRARREDLIDLTSD